MTRRFWVLATLLAALLPAAKGAATTYVYEGAAWAVVTPYMAPCAAGDCANFAPQGRATGTFTTATPLPPNMPGTQIYSLLTSFSFSDGINEYSSTAPATRVGDFRIATDGNGVPTLDYQSGVYLERWQAGISPHAAGERMASFALAPVGGGSAQNNDICTAVGTAPTGVADACLTQQPDASSSSAFTINGGRFGLATAAVATPTLSPAAAATLILVMAALGLAVLRSRTA